ncbi:MAG: Uma2 family endonuclease [Chloroflexota bacterium]
MKTFIITPEMSPAVEGPRQGEWTYTDWEALGDDENRYEIIEGVLYMTTAPKDFHQWIISRLIKYVGFPAEDQSLAHWRVAPIGVLMPGCDPVQPDFLIILEENIGIIHEGRIRGVPDLIVEVLSPGTRDYDEDVKLKAYANAGLPEYAVIDPRERKLRLYTLEEAGTFAEPHEFMGDDAVKFACLPSIEFRVSALFENALDTTL